MTEEIAGETGAIDTVTEEVRAELGPIQVLVNNAARVMDVNLNGAW